MAIGKTTLPTTTANQARLQLYQPTRRPANGERQIKTSWGSAKINGYLGQSHCNLMEAFFYHAEDVKNKDGRTSLLVDMHVIRKSLGSDGKTYSYETLNKQLAEIKRATIDLHINNPGDIYKGHIIDLCETSLVAVKPKATGGINKGCKMSARTTKCKAHDISGLFSGDRRLTVITLSETFTRLMNKDVARYYDPAQFKVLRFGVSQALARWVLSHKNSPPAGWHINKLLENIGIDATGIKRARSNIKKDADNLATIGINVFFNEKREIVKIHKL